MRPSPCSVILLRHGAKGPCNLTTCKILLDTTFIQIASVTILKTWRPADLTKQAFVLTKTDSLARSSVTWYKAREIQASRNKTSHATILCSLCVQISNYYWHTALYLTEKLYDVFSYRLLKECVSCLVWKGRFVHVFAHLPLHSFQDTKDLHNRRVTFVKYTDMECTWPRSIWTTWCRLVSSFALGATRHAWAVSASKQPSFLIRHRIVVTLEFRRGGLAARTRSGRTKLLTW